MTLTSLGLLCNAMVSSSHFAMVSSLSLDDHRHCVQTIANSAVVINADLFFKMNEIAVKCFNRRLY